MTIAVLCLWMLFHMGFNGKSSDLTVDRWR